MSKSNTYYMTELEKRDDLINRMNEALIEALSMFNDHPSLYGTNLGTYTLIVGLIKEATS